MAPALRRSGAPAPPRRRLTGRQRSHPESPCHPALAGHGEPGPEGGRRASLQFDDPPRNASLGEVPRAFNRPVEVRWFDEYRIALDRARTRYRIRG
ncbi:Hypothetical protein CAP_2971 [Chondromyces apiculatus DSM 436]|uniref:Uncharacterized protein n=1 Tax=Chondromyces apiculatus DSM 436 TaxID=1192034 RepID=A0A017TAQ0_9BACT|nr:Hypothetical protein CAP_2971 [Chondromyces apiculatus DSM 436]